MFEAELLRLVDELNWDGGGGGGVKEKQELGMNFWVPGLNNWMNSDVNYW